MLKKLTNADVDNIMDFWKYEVVKLDKSLKNQDITDKYTNVRDKFLKNTSSTMVYTEDDNICGFVSIINNEIWGILVKETIRREGIGTVLVESCKKKSKVLTAKVSRKNKEAIMFFKSNGFKIIDTSQDANDEDETYTLEWHKQEDKKAKLVYFDDDIDEKYLNDKLNFTYEKINLKKFIEEEKAKNLDIYNIKTYMDIRKKIEKVFNESKILLYIDYNNYYRYIDDQIKDYAKIKNIDLKIIVCEPFSIENTKKDAILKEIEESYRNYDIMKIDCSLEQLDKNININQIFEKRKELLVSKLQIIAEKM